MSLLEELKKKAEGLQTAEQQRSENVLRNIAIVDQKLRQIFSYLNELAKTLAVIKPEIQKPYILGTACKFENMQQVDHFADYRVNSIQDKECFDSVSFFFRNTGPRDLAVMFDDIFLAEQFEKSLWEYSIVFKRDDVLNAQRKIIKVNFQIPCEIRTEVLFQGEHETGLIRTTCKNIGRLGNDNLVFECDEINQVWLDELTKFVMTQPSLFKSGGKHQQIPALQQPDQLAVPEYEIHETPDEDVKKDASGLIGTVKGLWGIWKK